MQKLLTIFLLLICPLIYGQVKVLKIQTSLQQGHPTLKVQSTGITGQQSAIKMTKNTASIPFAFTTQYQTIIDYATANSISTPSTNQNIINNGIVNSLIQLGDWDSLDVFYYFKQEAGTPYQFLTLNWHDPSKFRLTKGGANDVAFVADSGFKVSGGNSQYFNMNYTPATDSVNFTSSNNGIIFKLFGTDTTFSQNGRIFGGAAVVGSQVSATNGATGEFAIKAYQTNGGFPVNGTSLAYIGQSKINGHYLTSTKTDRKFFKDGYYMGDGFQYSLGSGSETAPLCLFANNYLGTKYPSEAPVGLAYFMLGSSFRNDSGKINYLLNHPRFYHKETLPGTVAFTTASTAGFQSLYFIKIYPSAPFKAYFSGITKDYIVTYSTDHANGGASTPTPANGAIGWGQCDDPMMNGYEDKGIIIAGYQSETPSLILNPRDPNGQPVWLFYHPTTTYPGAGGIQQTRLTTTSGGIDLNHTTYTDRGTVLGLTPTESAYSQPHTGYSDVYMEADSTFTVTHGTQGWSGNTLAGIPKYGKSTNPGNSYVFTRIESAIDLTSYMPFQRLFHWGPALFFKRNGIQYAIGRNVGWENSRLRTDNFIAVYQCDGQYHPTSLLGNISSTNSGNNTTTSGFYIEGDTLYIYYVVNFITVYVTTWDLKNLD